MAGTPPLDPGAEELTVAAIGSPAGAPTAASATRWSSGLAR
ncbi:hypothetical protein ACWGMA_24585 [Streptomyces asiaticus]